MTLKYKVMKEDRKDEIYVKTTPPSCAPLFNDPTGDVSFVFPDENGIEQHIYAHTKFLSSTSDYYKTSEFMRGFASGVRVG